MTFVVRKLGYSRKPWRVVEETSGKEVWYEAGFDHPMLGPTVIPTPMGYERKRDAVAALAEAVAPGGWLYEYTLDPNPPEGTNHD